MTIQSPAVRQGLCALLLVLFTILGAELARSGDAGPPVPNPDDLIALVRKTVLAVDTGNKTGDYAALAAMGTQEFQTDNPAAKLADGFKKLRVDRIDLAPAATVVPQTTRPPSLDRNGLLRILGYFEFPAKQIVYDLVYAYDAPAMGWQLAGILIKPRDLPEQPVLMQPQ
jgi:hypothetical protein